MAAPVWAGVIPTALAFGAPAPDPKLDPAIAMPDCAARFSLAQNV